MPIPVLILPYEIKEILFKELNSKRISIEDCIAVDNKVQECFDIIFRGRRVTFITYMVLSEYL